MSLVNTYHFRKAWATGIWILAALPVQADQYQPVMQADYQETELRYYASDSQNASFLTRMKSRNLSFLECSGHLRTGRLVDYYQSDHGRDFDIRTGSYYRFNERLMLAGSLSYGADKGKHMSGSVFIHPEYAPFDIVEMDPSNAGTKRKEWYSLSGRAGYAIHDKLSLGAALDYTVENYAKFKDLRHQNSLTIFPQRYFPRLQIVFTVYPGTTKAGDPVTGQRYLNSKELVGSIPDMLLDTLSLVQQRMSTGAIVEGGLRKDVPDYPIVALREAIANALQHRDYSPEGRGTHVQVNMYSDRIEVSNPGGLYGATTVESLGKEGISASRNEFLSRLLTYTPFLDGYVVENKGTGFMTIESELARALMPPPTVKNSLTFFSLSFEKRRMSKPERSKRPNSLDETIIRAIHANGDLSIKELVAISGMSRTSISQHVRQLVETKILEPLENIRSPKQRYRLIVGRS